MKLVVLALMSIASAAALVSAQPAALNASIPSTAPPSLVPSNASHGDHARQVQCVMPRLSFGKWWYNSYNDGPHDCYGPWYESWAMFNSYRSGGTENVHWKYAKIVHDNDCLTDWKYYDQDGVTVIAEIRGRLTTLRDTQRWCALPVYRSGGVENKQSGYCVPCWDYP